MRFYMRSVARINTKGMKNRRKCDCMCKIFPIYHRAVWPVRVYNRLFKLARAQLRSKLTSNFTKGCLLGEKGLRNH